MQMSKINDEVSRERLDTNRLNDVFSLRIYTNDPASEFQELETGSYTYILLTKRECRTGRISARGLGSTDRAQRGPYEKDRGPIFSQYGPEQAWLIRDLLHD